MKGTEARSALEDQTVESLPPEREDTQATHEDSVKWHDILATMTSPLTLSLDPTPFSREECFSGPKRN